MAKIKIGNTREIELLDAIKNPSAINFKIGDKYAELTDDIGKTNGNPLLKFSKDGNEYYIREIFIRSGSFSVGMTEYSTKDITSQFPNFNQGTKINLIKWKIAGHSVERKNLGTNDFNYLMDYGRVERRIKRVGEKMYVTTGFATFSVRIDFTIE